MGSRKDWFEVDKDGLGRALAARGIEFAIGELIQNAWDADGVTNVSVRLQPVPHSPTVLLAVEDDSPAGFADLAHAYRLFGGSTKAKDPTKRGKWDLGEKLVFALARSAVVTSTSGCVTFDEKGRHLDRKVKRERGSLVEARLPMTRKDLDRCEQFIERLIPPLGITTTFNGYPVTYRSQIQTVRATLETQIADEEGRLRSRYRECDVHVHRPRPGEKGMIYELGLPVQETGDAYHYDIQQRVPVGFDRDAVTSWYLNSVRSAVLNTMATQVEDPAAEWVDRALEASNTSPETVKEIIRKRFGEKAVAADPTDQEAVHKATAAGYTIVHGGSLSSGIWEKVRQADALPRAGRIFPTRPEAASDDNVILPGLWTSGMRRVARYTQRLGDKLLGFEPIVRFVRHLDGGYLATWCDTSKTITFNVGKLGEDWFPQYGSITDDNVELIVHEFGHHFEGNHLSDKYNDALCKLAAKIRHLGHLDWEN